MSSLTALRLVDGRQVLFWVAYLVIMLLLWMIFTVWIPRRQYIGHSAKARQNMHCIQLALERFAVDNNGNYPLTVDELITNGYIPCMPENPFSGRPMQALPEDAPYSPGDFYYLPVGRDGSNTPPVEKYELKAFFRSD